MEVSTKKEFLEKLESGLSHLSDAERNDILYDYEEHFQIGMERGETEEEMIKKLGNPSTIVAQYLLELEIRQEHFGSGEKKPHHLKLLKLIMTAIGLGFFNVLFVLGFYIALILLVFSGFLFGFSSICSGLLCIFIPWLPVEIFFFKVPVYGMGTLPTNFFLLFAGIAGICFGMVFVMWMYRLSKVIYDWTYSYLRKNIEMIRNAGGIQ